MRIHGPQLFFSGGSVGVLSLSGFTIRKQLASKHKSGSVSDLLENYFDFLENIV